MGGGVGECGYVSTEYIMEPPITIRSYWSTQYTSCVHRLCFYILHVHLFRRVYVFTYVHYHNQAITRAHTRPALSLTHTYLYRKYSGAAGNKANLLWQKAHAGCGRGWRHLVMGQQRLRAVGAQRPARPKAPLQGTCMNTCMCIQIRTRTTGARKVVHPSLPWFTCARVCSLMYA